jgi:outer membrane protein TolC
MFNRLLKTYRWMMIGAFILWGAAPPSISAPPEIISPEAIRELVEKSFDVQAAKAKLIEDRANVTRAFDSYVPDVSLNATSYGFHESYRANTNPVYLNASFTIFDKGRDIFGIQQARSNLRVSEQVLNADRKDALIRAFDLYFRLTEAKENVRVLREVKKELDAVLEKSRSLVKAKALGKRQLSRMELDSSLLDNRIETTAAEVFALRTRLSAELQLDPESTWDVAPTSNYTIPKQYLKTVPEDLNRASASWSRSLALSERSYNLDGPTRWLAYSHQLPKVEIVANLGKADFNAVSTEFSIRANLEIPLPIFHIPTMLKPINTILNQKLRQNEIRRAQTLADVKANIESRTVRLNVAILQLQKLEKPLQEARNDRNIERQEVLTAGGQAFNFLAYLGQVRDLEIARNAAIRAKDTEYRALRILRGDDPLRDR